MQKDRESSLLPRFSVTRPVTVVVIFIALLVVGYIAYTKIPLEMMPSGFDPPFMGVWVPYPNATPAEIESQITRPIEEILGTVRNVQSTRSSIRTNFSWTGIRFNTGTDMDMAYAEVQDRMDRVKADLPDDVERIFIRRFDMQGDAEMWIALSINKEVPDLHYFLEQNLGKKLQRIEGVAAVEFDGVSVKNFEIELSMDKISAHRIDIRQLIQKLRNANFAIPSGFIREGNKRFNIRVNGRFRSIEEIKKLEVKPGILVEDIATIKFIVPKNESISRINANKGVWIRIDKDAGANSVDVHNAVVGVLKEELANNKNLEGIRNEYMFSQGQMIIDSLADLQETAFWAAIFAVLVLFFFLRHVRMTLVITLAIPISLLATIVIMYFTGETLNLLTLMGLMVCIGLVVDNSVVVVENIFRHRKANDDPKQAAIKGASEVGLAVVMATLTTVVVFLPLILMGQGGSMGFYMTRLGLPVIFALLASLFVALIFIPLTTTLFKDKGRIGSSKTINWVRERYVKMLRWTVNHRVETTLLSVAILFSIIFLTGDLGYQDEMRGSTNTVIRLRLDKKYSDIKGYPTELANRVEAWCRENNEGNLDFDVIATNIRSDMVRVRMYRPTRKDTIQLLEKPILWARNITFANDMQKDPESERRQYIKDHLMEDIGAIPGEAELLVGWGGSTEEKGTIELVLEGNDYTELRKWGERVRQEMAKIPGIVNVETDIETGNEELAVSINRERARTANVDTSWAVSTISQAVRGVQLPKFQERDREINIRVRLREEDLKSVANFKNLRIPTIDGREVPLSSIASIDYTRGPSSITHINKKPNYNLKISGNSDRLDKLIPLVEGAMQNLGNGPGFSYSFGERRMRMRQDSSNFLFAVVLAVFFVFLLMGVLFESFALPLTIICCIPFAFAGSQLLLKAYNLPANLFAYIGIIIIVGVVVNNGIVLVDLINRLRRQGMSRIDAILKAGHHRFRPILMTSGTTIFSLVPMAFGDVSLVGIPYNPLGMAMIGGLALNSLLTLIMVPVFYTMFDDMKKIWHWMISLLFGRARTAPTGETAGAGK